MKKKKREKYKKERRMFEKGKLQFKWWIPITSLLTWNPKKKPKSHFL
jgi:hypothetical protein